MGKREEVESYERAARALKAKEITADQFLLATRERWRRTARYIHERWRRKLPAWVEPEDVEQELVLLVLLAIRRYSRRRAGKMTLGQYATWGAIHRTQRQIHRWREASLSGNEGRNPSRCEIAFCRAFGPETEPVREGTAGRGPAVRGRRGLRAVRGAARRLRDGPRGALADGPPAGRGRPEGGRAAALLRLRHARRVRARERGAGPAGRRREPRGDRRAGGLGGGAGAAGGLDRRGGWTGVDRRCYDGRPGVRNQAADGPRRARGIGREPRP